MNFLIVPSKGFTDYLVKRARKFGGPKASVEIWQDSNHLTPDLSAVMVIKGERKRAEKINQLRMDRKLSELFIVEVPYPKVHRKIIRSPVRARISKLLEAGPLHGYAIYRKYLQTYNSSISLRLVYYHLHRGLKDGVFQICEIEEKKGDFSWGNRTMRKLYKLSGT